MHRTGPRSISTVARSGAAPPAGAPPPPALPASPLPPTDAHTLDARDPLDFQSWPPERRRHADCVVRISTAPAGVRAGLEVAAAGQRQLQEEDGEADAGLGVVVHEFPAHSVLLEQACGWARGRRARARQRSGGAGAGAHTDASSAGGGSCRFIGPVLELVVADEAEADAARLLFRCMYAADEPLRPLVGWSFAALEQVGAAGRTQMFMCDWDGLGVG
jgi:hypothetical protein